MNNNLPPRTEDEEKGIKLVQDYFDFEVDYTKGGPLLVEDEEQCHLMNLGWARFWREEMDEWERLKN